MKAASWLEAKGKLANLDNICELYLWIYDNIIGKYIFLEISIAHIYEW
jgi:hypothetical protein